MKEPNYCSSGRSIRSAIDLHKVVTTLAGYFRVSLEESLDSLCNPQTHAKRILGLAVGRKVEYLPIPTNFWLEAAVGLASPGANASVVVANLLELVLNVEVCEDAADLEASSALHAVEASKELDALARLKPRRPREEPPIAADRVLHKETLALL